MIVRHGWLVDQRKFYLMPPCSQEGFCAEKPENGSKFRDLEEGKKIKFG